LINGVSKRTKLMRSKKESKSPEDNTGACWDLSDYFPAFGGQEMQEFKKSLTSDICQLCARAAELDVLSAKTSGAWEEIYLGVEDCSARLSHIFSYVGCLSAADSSNDDYSAEGAALQLLAVDFEKLNIEVLRALRGAEESFLEEFIDREKLQPIGYALRRDFQQAARTMTPAEERLASELGTDGLKAWSRLYDRLSGKLEFDMCWPDGRRERLPISQWRSLMDNPDRNVGRAAFEAGNRAWATIEDSCAAALNAISGTRLTLYRRRGLPHFLDDALFGAGINSETLEAMYQAIGDNITIPREIYRAKAALMGRQQIEWFERCASLPLEGVTSCSWSRGRDMVGSAFERSYPGLASYYRSMLEKGWIESQPRPGKRPGAFCTNSPLISQQRVYMTFNGSVGDVSTLAHEVGHAWHGWLLREVRPLARKYPMTLAETASIFAEHILSDGILADPDIDETSRLLVLDSDLTGAATLLLDITARYEFEKAFYEQRSSGQVSVPQLRELMISKQQEVFGDAMVAGGGSELFWASKLHYYIAGVSFYNFPYTFGFLLARTLYALFQEAGSDFLPTYEEFLRQAGSDTVENVVGSTLGLDITKPEFWARGIQSLRGPLETYAKTKPLAGS
jgi:oligoendopeptidase F